MLFYMKLVYNHYDEPDLILSSDYLFFTSSINFSLSIIPLVENLAYCIVAEGSKMIHL